MMFVMFRLLTLRKASKQKKTSSGATGGDDNDTDDIPTHIASLTLEEVNSRIDELKDNIRKLALDTTTTASPSSS
jgi:hypothetical protein